MIWIIRLALVAAGVGTMWWEGQQQPAPGIGFAIGLACFGAAALVGSERATR